ncbi:MAG: nitroreductase family deazaflavin-dependent oxidoreductase [Ilumatobacteraceae bacterium]
MPLNGEYEPSTTQWVRDQVELYESSGGTQGTDMRGMPVVILTMRGQRSGKLRKVPLMRVEHDGTYAAVASVGGAAHHPLWYHNLLADPHIELQDGEAKHDMIVRELNGDEKAQWWVRCVAAFPNYAEYQAKTDREIPVLLAEPAS